MITGIFFLIGYIMGAGQVLFIVWYMGRRYD
jgi:hypothetical protein